MSDLPPTMNPSENDAPAPESTEVEERTERRELTPEELEELTANRPPRQVQYQRSNAEELTLILLTQIRDQLKEMNYYLSRLDKE